MSPVYILANSVLAPNVILDENHSLYEKYLFAEKQYPVFQLRRDNENAIKKLVTENPGYLKYDRVVLLAILAFRQLLAKSVVDFNPITGINIGSARGATGNWEKYHQSSVENNSDLSPLASPLTTAGSISSLIWRDYRRSVIGNKHNQGASNNLTHNQFDFTHSVTCNSGMYAIGNALAWLRSGMAKYFIAGGVEAPLTDFGINMFRALKIFKPITANQPYPCRPFNIESEDTLCLGEGAALFLLGMEPPIEGPIFQIESFAFATETTPSLTGISPEGDHIYHAMQTALENQLTDYPVDLVIAHAPGTIQGDLAEFNAINKLFYGKRVSIWSSKWITGHTLGASGCISLSWALRFLSEEKIPPLPYPTYIESKTEMDHTSLKTPPKKILINSAGFGGNAMSLLISKL